MAASSNEFADTTVGNNRYIFCEKTTDTVLGQLYRRGKGCIGRYPLGGSTYTHLPKTDLPLTPVEIVTKLINNGYTPYICNEKVEWSPKSVEQPAPAIVDSAVIKVMEDYYSKAKTLEEKQACLTFILHTQHYNADFTVSENQRLGYQNPLIAAQTAPGYFRTEYKRVFELCAPWLNSTLVPYLKRVFVGCGKPLRYTKISSLLAIPVLKASFADTVEIHDLRTLALRRGPSCRKAQMVVIPLKIEDLKKDLEEVIKEQLSHIEGAPPIERLRTRNPKICFLFQLQQPPIDCTVLWGGKWAKAKSNNTLQCLGLNSHDFFGKDKKKDVFGILNKMGAIPDRMELNAFLSQGLSQQSFSDAVQSLGIHKQDTPLIPFGTWELFEKKLQEVAGYKFINDSGSRRYRDAILRWDACFFDHYRLRDFATPLLCEQCLPWMTQKSGVVQWAKAYQNICEIVMFCIQSFPEKFTDVDYGTITAELMGLKGELSSLHRSAGLYPYAMSTVFQVLEQILQRQEFAERPVSLTAVSQNYYETLLLIDTMSSQGHLVPVKKKCLDHIDELPDIVVTDIHPNNAKKNKLFQNDVGRWIQHSLNANPDKHLIVILDITLNDLSDLVIHNLFRKVKPYIEEGRLEIFGIQSLAKLVQIGADNFSGGTCLYWGKDDDPAIVPKLSAGLREKAIFFALQSFHFGDLNTGYFEHVRMNTEWMYQALTERFSEIAASTWLDNTHEEGNKVQTQFCATKITLNTDEKTVYVAINFKPLLEVLDIPKELEQYTLVNNFKKTLLAMAEQRGLPITGRQSFGFSLSNMSDVCQSIRFSIGVESPPVLEQYADLVNDFVSALSRYVTDSPTDFSFKTFEEGIIKSNAIFTGKESLSPFKTSWMDEDLFYINETTQLGDAEIHYYDRQLSLALRKTGEDKTTIIPQSHIQMILPSGLPAYELESSHLMKLLFQITTLNNKTICVKQGSKEGIYAIQGIERCRSLFFDDESFVDEESDIALQFNPTFILTLRDKRAFTGDQVVVRIEDELGTAPVPVSKLNALLRNKIYTNCVRYKLSIKRYEKRPGSVFLKFSERKPFLNYPEKIVGLYNTNQGRLFGIVEFLNHLDKDAMLLPHDFSWTRQEKGVTSISYPLKGLGDHIANKLTAPAASELMQIEEGVFLIAILEGMFDGLLTSCLQIKGPLKPAVAEVIAELFGRDDLPEFPFVSKMNNWIKEMKEAIEKDPAGFSHVPSYLKAMLPLIKRAFILPDDWNCTLLDLQSIETYSEQEPDFDPY